MAELNHTLRCNIMDPVPKFRAFESPRFHYTFGPHEPMLRVASGASLRVICPDSDSELADGSVLDHSRRERGSGSPYLQGNPMAGPIHVEGAQPGDCLSVDIDAIHLD